MTDKEIIKALGCCTDYHFGGCDDCPYKATSKIVCHSGVMRDTLDLINRQQAEIERLTAGQKILHKCIASIKTEAFKDFAERLKKKAFISSSPYSALKVVAVFDIAVLEQQMTEEQE